MDHSFLFTNISYYDYNHAIELIPNDYLFPESNNSVYVYNFTKVTAKNQNSGIMLFTPPSSTDKVRLFDVLHVHYCRVTQLAYSGQHNLLTMFKPEVTFMSSLHCWVLAAPMAASSTHYAIHTFTCMYNMLLSGTMDIKCSLSLPRTIDAYIIKLNPHYKNKNKTNLLWDRKC